MKNIYKDQFLEVYEGDSLLAADVVPVKSCKLAILTPLGKKNINEHYPEMVKLNYDTDPKDYLATVYADFTNAWVKMLDDVLTEDGNIVVGCLPKEKDDISKALLSRGYSMTEEFIVDMTALPMMSDMAKAYKHNIDLYLIFNKTGFATKIGADKFDYPKDLLRKIIKKCTQAGDIVFHPFSNTAKVAAITPKLFTKCIVISDDPYWCQVAVDRATDEERDKYWSKDLM